MAHGDTLIFLTNISWIFFLFLFCYFFFVLFFLPTFYKKVRARTLIRADQQRFVLVLLANSIVGSSLFLKELTRSYFSELVTLALSANSLRILPTFNFVSAKIERSANSLNSGFYLGATSADSSTKLISYFDKFNK